MQKEIQSLVNAYLMELGNEAVTITALVRFVSDASDQRRKMLRELEKYFQSDAFRESTAQSEPVPDFENKTTSLLKELEKNFQRMRLATPVSAAGIKYS